MPELSFQDACVKLGTGGGPERVLFSHLTFELGAGERLAVLGPNGSGKSTILDLIMGVRQPSGGAVRLRSPRGSLVHIPQEYRLALFPWLKFRTHIELYSGFPGGFDRALCEEAVRTFDLTRSQQQPVFTLSGGEQQLLVLITSLSCRAPLYLLDEPFAAIDSGRRKLAMQFVEARLSDQRAALVLVTHDIADASALASRALVLSGRGDVLPQLWREEATDDFEKTLLAASGH